jgi:hypothetical protein
MLPVRFAFLLFNYIIERGQGVLAGQQRQTSIRKRGTLLCLVQTKAC